MVGRKFQHALALALLFYVVSSPFTYKMVDKLIGGFVEVLVPYSSSFFKVAESGCPTNYGLLVHSVVFGVVSYYIMHSSS